MNRALDHVTPMNFRNFNAGERNIPTCKYCGHWHCTADEIYFFEITLNFYV